MVGPCLIFLYVLCPPVTSVLTQTCQVRMQALVPDTWQHLQRSYGVHAASGIKENIKICNTCTEYIACQCSEAHTKHKETHRRYRGKISFGCWLHYTFCEKSFLFFFSRHKKSKYTEIQKLTFSIYIYEIRFWKTPCTNNTCLPFLSAQLPGANNARSLYMKAKIPQKNALGDDGVFGPYWWCMSIFLLSIASEEKEMIMQWAG